MPALPMRTIEEGGVLLPDLILLVHQPATERWRVGGKICAQSAAAHTVQLPRLRGVRGTGLGLSRVRTIAMGEL